jgi:hypothetical protein
MVVMNTVAVVHQRGEDRQFHDESIAEHDFESCLVRNRADVPIRHSNDCKYQRSGAKHNCDRTCDCCWVLQSSDTLADAKNAKNERS